MSLTILFFGAVAEATGMTSIEFPSVQNTEKLNEQLLLLYPSLKKKTYRIAVNKKLISGKTELKARDTVALLPPFAGG